jgi:hypothetical protein
VTTSRVKNNITEKKAYLSRLEPSDYGIRRLWASPLASFAVEDVTKGRLEFDHPS